MRYMEEMNGETPVMKPDDITSLTEVSRQRETWEEPRVPTASVKTGETTCTAAGNNDAGTKPSPYISACKNISRN